MIDRWSTKIGIVLAVAGSAVGLGNFLRFPAKAVQNGGGAFMLPYFVAFIILALPLMVTEMALGRYGGKRGFSTLPGILQSIFGNRLGRWLGTVGIVLPIFLASYYIYIESWCFAYAWYSLTGELYTTVSPEGFHQFLTDYQNPQSGHFINTYLFFLLAFFINFYVVWRGIKKGIERLCIVGMSLLLILAIFLFIRIFTLDTSDPVFSGRRIVDALQFIWQPDFSALSHPRLWMEAASQIFFSTSVGFGVVATYSSYLNKKDDVTLSALSSCSVNEFFEIIFGASLVIPVTFLFFGAAQSQEIVQEGIFNMGFVTMPMIFSKMHFGSFFSFIWFALLAVSAVTSSVSLIKPFTAFLEQDLGWGSKKAIIAVSLLLFLTSQTIVWFCKNGTINEADFWCGNILIVLTALLISVSFFWIYGTNNAVKEIMDGSLLRIPNSFWFICKYITPVVLIVLAISSFFDGFLDILFMRNVSPEDVPYIWLQRGIILLVFVITILLTNKLKEERK